MDCQDCDLRGTLVMGIGNPNNPQMMLIGEAPGATEDQTGEPFTGLAGQELRAILRENDINQHTAYITNLVKHRPPMNRTPTKEESNKCFDRFLSKEISQIKPNVIVTLGKTSTEFLANKANFKIKTQFRSSSFHYGETLVIPTWHPSYVIRAQGTANYKVLRTQLKNDLLYAKNWQKKLELF